MDPDPLVRGTDPGIRLRIRTKMSRIPNTGLETMEPTDSYASSNFELSPDLSYCIESELMLLPVKYNQGIQRLLCPLQTKINC